MSKNTMVAMILAGGKGTRLESLTRKNAKPAVFFGGKYRIIDFVLSSVSNSGINTVGVLTQYESSGLNTYIGNGSKWGIDGNRSLTSILPPKQTEEGAVWYRGTADAIYQNLDWIDSVDPDYVLILSGDHIYKMNFQEMLDVHLSHNADVTIATIDVSLDEAKRFGILTADSKDQITEFTEKPKHPKSTLASMGIYIFNYKLLRDSLKADAKLDTDHDFGKNIIPSLLEHNKKLFVYRFEGYWKDVGTIQSLWQANMDLLEENNNLNLYDQKIRIFSEDTHSLPMYIGGNSEISSSIINQGSSIMGKIHHSVVFTGAIIEEGASVLNSVIMPGAIIKSGVSLNYVMVGPDIEVENSVESTSDDIKLINR